MTFAYRQDFGFGNPNIAGAFFAVLVLAVFLVSARARWMRALRFLIAGVFFGCLLLTASRGALFGLGLGSIAAWSASGFPRPRSGWLLLACAVVVSAVLGARAIQRVSSLSASEGSTASRIAIYRCVPAMVAAAPGGWGYGRAANAYENWFQDPDDTTPFKNLLSTHATWIVERGWLFFAGYTTLWILALLLCNPTALGVMVTWGTCCAFSHVGGAWWMWVVPAVALGVSLYDRWKRNVWPARKAWIVAAGFLALIFFFCASMRPKIHYDGRVVRVGSGAPRLWFLAPDLSVMGKTYGKNLRALGNIAVAQRWEDVRSPVILSGNAPVPSGPCHAKQIVWLNPPEQIDPRLRQLFENSPDKTVLWGALRGDANSRPVQTWIESLPNSRWILVPGRGKYLGDALGSVTKL